MSAPLRLGREFARGNRALLVAVGALALLSAGGSLSLPMLVALLIQAIQDDGELTGWLLLIMGTAITSAAAAALAGYLLARAGYQLMYRLRTRLMDHTLAMRILDVRREGSANLASRLSGDTMQIKNAVDLVPLQLPVASLILVGSLVLMGVLDLVLLVITVAAFAAALAVVGVVLVLLRRHYTALQDRLGWLSDEYAAALDGLKLIKTTRSEPAVAAALAARADELRRIGTEAARLESLGTPAVSLGQQIALLAVLVVGGARVVSGALSVGAYVGFLFYLLQLAAPLVMLVSSGTTVQAALTARRRFDEVFAYPPERTGGIAELRPVAGAPALEIEDGWLTYDGSPALSGVDLTVPARGLTALVGVSGAGKSSVLELVEQLIEPDSGTVRVFGVDAGEVRLAALRGRLAHLDQTFVLLARSVRDNLTLGRDDDPTDEVLLAALEQVGLRDHVEALPDGLDTELGGAQDLSGGQRQRLALARVLLSDAPLVLLDEPTSQIDGLNEQRLRAAVRRLAQDRAVLMVAHRMSTVRDASRVIVLDEGRVVAQGSQEDLLATCPQYLELVQLQAPLAGAPA